MNTTSSQIVVHTAPIEDRKLRSIISSEFCFNDRKKSVVVTNKETGFIHMNRFPVQFDETLTSNLYMFVTDSNIIMPSWEVNESANTRVVRKIRMWENVYTFQDLTNNSFIFPDRVSEVIEKWIDRVVDDEVYILKDLSSIVKEYLHYREPLKECVREMKFISEDNITHP